MHTTDEAKIRHLVATWMAATRAGDVATVMGLMADDVVFLMPGRPPMSKADFQAVACDSSVAAASAEWAAAWTTRSNMCCS